MNDLLSRFILVSGISVSACGGSATRPATAPAGAAVPTPDPTAASAAAPGTDAAAPAPSEPKVATGPTQEDLEKKKSLDLDQSPFPEIDEVTKDLGPPAKSGKGKAVSFWYDTETRFVAGTKKDHTACRTLDLVRSPSGGVVLDTSMYNSPECKKVKATLAQVHEAFDEIAGRKGARPPSIQLRERDLRGKTFEAVVATFEKKLGKAPVAGERDYAAWTYVVRQEELVGDEPACRMVLVTSHLGSGAGQAFWDVPCD